MLNLLKSLTQISTNLLNKAKRDQIYEEAMAFYEAKEYKPAFAKMKESAELGSPHAMSQLAVMCLKGEGHPPDWEKTAELFRMTLELQNYQGCIFPRATLLANLVVSHHEANR